MTDLGVFGDPRDKATEVRGIEGRPSLAHEPEPQLVAPTERNGLSLLQTAMLE